MKKKIVIGLTGGLGSGKSTVLAEFKRLGAVTADADEIARRVVEPGGPAYAKVVKLFGPAVVRSDRTLDRKAIAARVFKSPSLRKKLEAIIHPLVRRELRRAVERTKKGVVVLDIPLLYESGLEKMVDRVCVVWTPAAVRLRRLASAGKFTPGDIRARLKAQMPLAEKRRRADHVIENGGPLRQTLSQTKSLYGELFNS